MKVGIIGTGWGRTHCGTFREAGCEITVLLSRREEQAARVAAEEGVAIGTSDPRALETCDLVVIASPTATHLEYLERFRHKPVFCEKPLGPGPLSDRELARFDGMSAFVNYAFPFLDSARTLENRIAAPTFGAVRRILLDVGVNFAAPKTPVEWFHEVAVHPLSLLLHLFGAHEMAHFRIGDGPANVSAVFINGEHQLDTALYWLPTTGLCFDLKIVGQGAVARLSGGYRPERDWWLDPVLVDEEPVSNGESSDGGSVWYRANSRAAAQFCAVVRGEISRREALARGSFDLAKAAAMERMLAPLLAASG